MNTCQSNDLVKLKYNNIIAFMKSFLTFSTVFTKAFWQHAHIVWTSFSSTLTQDFKMLDVNEKWVLLLLMTAIETMHLIIQRWNE